METPFDLHWLSCGTNPALAERFFVADFAGDLPFLLEGPAPDPAQAPEALNEEQLLKGLLAGLAELDHAGRPALRTQDQPVLLQLLEVMRQGFSFEDVEEMVVETSGNLRARHGVKPSCAALTTGVLLAPGATRLKADLLLDLWGVARLAGVGGATPFLERMPALLDDLDPTVVPPPTLEACTYFTLAARHMLGDFSEPVAFEEFMVERVVEVVHHPLLKQKVQELAAAEQVGKRLSFAELHVD